MERREIGLDPDERVIGRDETTLSSAGRSLRVDTLGSS
jgi:hypothetical protein